MLHPRKCHGCKDSTKLYASRSVPGGRVYLCTCECVGPCDCNTCANRYDAGQPTKLSIRDGAIKRLAALVDPTVVDDVMAEFGLTGLIFARACA